MSREDRVARPKKQLCGKDGFGIQRKKEHARGTRHESRLLVTMHYIYICVRLWTGALLAVQRVHLGPSFFGWFDSVCVTTIQSSLGF